MKRFVLLFALCGFVLAGCDDQVQPPASEVSVYLSTSPLSDASVKSAATAAENMVTRLVLYGVDDQDMVVYTSQVLTNPSLTGIKLEIPLEVETLYAVAIPLAGIGSATPSTLSELLDLTGNFATAPGSPFLMGGKGDIVDSKANIELVRAVAKIEVLALNDFQIESVAVGNTPNRGYIFKQETPAPPTSSERVDYPANTTNSTVYVAENSSDDPTELLIIGTYLGKQATYTIVLKKGGTPVDIVRNTCYQVGVSAITDSDCMFTVKIPEWEDGEEIDDHIIPDENFDE